MSANLVRRMIVALVACAALVPVTRAGAATTVAVRERTWLHITSATHPTGNGPLTYDSGRHQTVLFVPGATPETWVFDGGTHVWTKKSPAHAPDVAGGAMAFDAAHGVVALLGNTPGQQFCDNFATNETWTWNGTDWSQLHPATAPEGCFGGQLVYDAKTARVLAVSDEQEPRGWSWDGTNWSELSSVPFVFGTSATYDAAHGKVLVFGGDFFFHGYNDRGNTLYWDGATSTTANAGGGTFDPQPRAYTQLIYDAQLGAVVMFDGISTRYDGLVTKRYDTWQWNGAKWFQIGTQSAGARTAGKWVYDTDDQLGVYYGSGETWLWTFASAGGGNGATNASGKVAVAGDAKSFGDTSALRLAQPIVGIARTPTRQGYWLVARDGGIFAYGDAHFYGSTGGFRLNQPIVGIAATPSGHGYWLVASDGGIFAFGDAQFFGSTGGFRLNQPIVGMTSTPIGDGYWLVARDGGIFAFGRAKFYGSTGGIRLNQPIVGMAASPTGKGYWFVARDGGVFAFGDARFFGAQPGPDPVAAMASSPTGRGYWLFHADGRVDHFGDALAHGNLAIAGTVGAFAT